MMATFNLTVEKVRSIAKKTKKNKYLKNYKIMSKNEN